MHNNEVYGLILFVSMWMYHQMIVALDELNHHCGISAFLGEYWLSKIIFLELLYSWRFFLQWIYMYMCRRLGSL